MTRVLLLNPPFEEVLVRDNYCCHTSKGDYVWAPADLLYVSAILDQADIQLYAIDAIVEKKDKQSVLREISAFNPDVVITLSGTVSFSTDIDLLRQLSEQIGGRYFLMGNLPVFNAALVLEKYDFIDGIFHNFFDPNILEHIRHERVTGPGISMRSDDGSYHIGKVNYLERKAQPKVGVPRYDLFPASKYSTPISLRSPMTTVITAFGCPYDCKFCVASALNLYPRPLEDLEAEFDGIQKAGIKELFFMDSTFNAIPKRLREICDLMIRKDYNFTWSCNVHCMKYSVEDFSLMKQAGCHTVQIGVEAGHTASREEFAPTKSDENLRGVFDAAHRAGLRTLGYFIIGFPEEGKDQVQQTIDFAKELDPHFAAFTTLMPDYGTEFYLEAREKQMIDEGLHAFDNSGQPILRNMILSADDRKRMLRRAYLQFYLRPRQVLKYLADPYLLALYMRNGMHVLRKFIFN